MSAGGTLNDLNSSLETSRSVSNDAVAACPQPDAVCWYVAYTNARHEKHVARQLEERHVASFLPTYRSVRRWKDRRKELELPLFPGYVFVQLCIRERLRVLQIPGVVRLVSFGGYPVPVSDSEIQSLKNAVAGGVLTTPHPYLKVGRRVRVKHGPLAGMEGILVRKKDRYRVVMSIDLIMRSVATEVQVSDLE